MVAVPAYRLDVEYEGTRYRGWQLQANARSVAGELQRAVGEAGGALVELGGSGRTDAGVHALAQTAHLKLRHAVEPQRFRLALNDLLPKDIHVLSLLEADERFHARHDAVERSYLYQIARRRTALAKPFVWWIKRPLDAERMARAAEQLAGRHDFASLCEQPSRQPSTVVALERAELAETGDLVLVRLVASHFLWKMVRRVVGVLVRIGAGELGPDELARLLAPDRGDDLPPVAAWTAPPSGLFLERAVYPDEAPLAPLAPASPVAAPSRLGQRYTGPRAAGTVPGKRRRGHGGRHAGD
jgi:tRNA pseudouridine38-40 synthase